MNKIFESVSSFQNQIGKNLSSSLITKVETAYSNHCFILNNIFLFFFQFQEVKDDGVELIFVSADRSNYDMISHMKVCNALVIELLQY